MNTSNIIDNTFYDNNTFQILFDNMNDDDINYIKEKNLDIIDELFIRWSTIISSLMCEHYNEYATIPIELRNIWFKKYICLPSHDMTVMPISLLPL